MAGEVVSQSEWFSWSLNQFSREFGIARETVQSRLRAADVKPSGEKRGFPIYSVSAAAKAILLHDTSTPGLNDPEKMTPKEQRDWFAGQIDKRKLAQLDGELVNKNESREQMALIAKIGLQVLETLPDILERDFHLDAEIIAAVEARIDTIREQWAQAMEN
jgi:hypothetical protein